MPPATCGPSISSGLSHHSRMSFAASAGRLSLTAVQKPSSHPFPTVSRPSRGQEPMSPDLVPGVCTGCPRQRVDRASAFAGCSGCARVGAGRSAQQHHDCRWLVAPGLSSAAEAPNPHGIVARVVLAGGHSVGDDWSVPVAADSPRPRPAQRTARQVGGRTTALWCR